MFTIALPIGGTSNISRCTADGRAMLKLLFKKASELVTGVQSGERVPEIVVIKEGGRKSIKRIWIKDRKEVR